MFKNYLTTILVYLVLELGALCGVPMRPDQIEETMKINQRPAIVEVEKRGDDL
jgi:hypothetical protein